MPANWRAGSVASARTAETGITPYPPATFVEFCLGRPAETIAEPGGNCFLATKTPEQQSCLMLHRTRHLFIRQQTSVINAIRAHLAEFGIVAPVGRKGVEELLNVVADASDKRLPEVARACLAALGVQNQHMPS
jgi:hypothetical protein